LELGQNTIRRSYQVGVDNLDLQVAAASVANYHDKA